MPVRRPDVISGVASSCLRLSQCIVVHYGAEVTESEAAPDPETQAVRVRKEHWQGMSMRDPAGSSSSVSLEVPRSKNVLFCGEEWLNMGLS